MRRSIQSDPEYSLSLEKLPTVNDPPMLGVEIAFFSSIYDFFFNSCHTLPYLLDLFVFGLKVGVIIMQNYPSRRAYFVVVSNVCTKIPHTGDTNSLDRCG